VRPLDVPRGLVMHWPSVLASANPLREGQRFVRPSREDAGRHGRCGKTLVRRRGETRAGLGYDVPILFPRQDVITSV
jgi:hypothetical protein